MPYEAEWSFSIVGKGKVFPVDADSIMQLFADTISTINGNSEHTVDLKLSHIHQGKITEY